MEFSVERSHLLRMENISKAFPGVQALDDVSLDVCAGEVLGLIGENGAGKSTLMKILSGVYVADSGQITIEDEPVQVRNPHHAQELGISIIYQEFNLMPNMSVMENISIGREPAHFSMVNRPLLKSRAQELLSQLRVDLSPSAIVRDLSVAEQQMVEIAKALSMEVKVLIMDEPTSALCEAEVQALLDIIRDLKRSGIGIIFISHRLEEVRDICDRVTVLRDGQNIGTISAAEASEDRLIQMMVGRSLKEYFHLQNGGAKEAPSPDANGDIALELRGIARSGSKRDPHAVVLDDISFSLKKGEILGLAGLVGSGRTEVARVIFGADPRDSGDILIGGQPVDIQSPIDAIRHGIGFVPEDRKAQGLILGMTVRENATLPNLDRLSRFSFVRLHEEADEVNEYVKRLDIQTPGLEQQVVNLSGGNQQKVVMTKWLMLKPRILILDEPTRGIDVGAKAEIYSLMKQLAADGVSIIMISSELPEVLAMSDRIVCMYEGQVSGIVDGSEATPELVMRYCTTRKENNERTPV
jgi:ABC-type sugar transport system ATPase subunit